MTYKFVIPGRFASLNEYIAALSVRRGSWIKGRAMKREDVDRVVKILDKEFQGKAVYPPIVLKYSFYEKSGRRDIDNICGYAHKVINDALQEAGVIPNDNWHIIVGFEDHFYIDKENPRVEVEIVEVEHE